MEGDRDDHDIDASTEYSSASKASFVGISTAMKWNIEIFGANSPIARPMMKTIELGATAQIRD